ncbi:hypothetical protein TI05_02445 [Achromatium sp. WMS3]|nr:hypothetical protein TI05_02445 [Achromatium sp. WMS3]
MKYIPFAALSPNTVERIKYLILASLTIIFIAIFSVSLSWRVRGDAVFLHYLAYLINEHDFVPYRDFFELNMPGTYLFHIMIGKLFGYSLYTLRTIHIAWFTATLVITWFIMRPFGNKTAIAGCLLFGIIYLGYGTEMSLQRDFIIILPIAIAILITIRHRPNYTNLIHFLLGILFALVALVKPYHAIGLPVLIVYNCLQDGNKSISAIFKSCIGGGILALLSFLLILSMSFLWLWHIGALTAFGEIVTAYTPLYAQISGDLTIRKPLAHVIYTLYRYVYFKDIGILMLAATLGTYIFVTKPQSTVTKNLSILLFFFCILHALSAGIGGKVWNYHLIPYMYFVSLSAAITLYSPPLFANVYRSNIIPVLVFIMAITPIVLKSTGKHVILRSKSAYELSIEMRMDEISTYLQTHLAAGDKIQLLSWAGGVMEPMLAAKAIIATRYITDFQFYHHVSNPYIKNLRQDVMTKLKQAMPKFIIDVYALRIIAGADTSYEFPELKAFIKQHYKKDYIGNNEFNIFRRNDG